MKRLLFSLVLVLVFALPLSAATVDGLKLHSSSAGKGPKTVIPGTGHFLMMEKPDEFNRLLAGL